MKDTKAIVREFLVTNPGHSVSSTLDGAVTASGTTLALATGGGSGFPSEQNFLVLVGTELILVTRSGDTLTVELGGRGLCGTTAAAHADGAAVYQAVLYDVVGVRVSTRPARSNDSPWIWIANLNEGREADAPVYEGDVEFRCFGGTGEELDELAATLVYRLLVDRLHGQGISTGTQGTLCWAHFESGGQCLAEPEVGWAFVFARFSVVVR